jgi:hypothetical protein
MIVQVVGPVQAGLHCLGEFASGVFAASEPKEPRPRQNTNGFR